MQSSPTPDAGQERRMAAHGKKPEERSAGYKKRHYGKKSRAARKSLRENSKKS